MELKQTWLDKLKQIMPGQCVTIGDAPIQSVYSSIRANKKELEKLGMKFKLPKDKDGKRFICRVK